MNDRIRKIDEFLKFFRDVAIQNPNHNFNRQEIYHCLTNLGIPANENNKQIDTHFDSWIHHFESNSNIRVFVDPEQSYFCQFLSADGKAGSSKEHLKLYVPLDSEHIEKGAKEIFEFLSNQGISHESKIATHIRFDNIVIRLIDPKAVSTLINFINNNSYIQEGLLPANPFAFNINRIALAIDGRLSYNTTLSTLILLYINEKKLKNNLETINVFDFYRFVANYYNNVFTSAEGLARLKSDFHWKSQRFKTEEEQLVNYKNIFELIIKSIDKNFTFNDYIKHYYECSNLTISRQKEEELRNADKKSPDSSIEKTNNFILQVIDIMSEKSANQNETLYKIQCYLYTGESAWITRHKDLRNIMTNSNFRKNVMQILNDRQMTFTDYASGLLDSRKKQTPTSKNSENDHSAMEKDVILKIEEILEIMSNKYGERNAYNNLNQYFATGDPNKLTRDHNLRQRIVNSTFRNDLKQVLAYHNLSLNDYLAAITQTKTGKSEMFLEQAILETYSKYEIKYSIGLSKTSGKKYVIGSLVQLINYGNYDGFTRNNGARENLINNVSVSEIVSIIKEKLKLEKNRIISKNEVVQLAENYISLVLNKQKEQPFKQN